VFRDDELYKLMTFIFLPFTLLLPLSITTTVTAIAITNTATIPAIITTAATTTTNCQ